MKKNILVLSSLSLFLLTGCDSDDHREVDLVMAGQYELKYFERYVCNNKVILTNNLTAVNGNPGNVLQLNTMGNANVFINISDVEIKTNVNYTFDDKNHSEITDEKCKEEIKKYENSILRFNFNLQNLIRINDEYVKIDNVKGDTLKPENSSDNVKSNIEFKETPDDLEALSIIINNNDGQTIGKLQFKKTF